MALDSSANTVILHAVSTKLILLIAMIIIVQLSPLHDPTHNQRIWNVSTDAVYITVDSGKKQ